MWWAGGGGGDLSGRLVGFGVCPEGPAAALSVTTPVLVLVEVVVVEVVVDV